MNLKKLIFLSLLVSTALVLSIVEGMIPVPIPVPGVKLGLPNIIFLLTLVLFGFKEALIVAFLRGLIMGIATGNISSLMYSLPSSLTSILVMSFVYRYFSDYFSLIGVSLFGALAFNTVQIAIASLIMENARIFTYLPIMSLTSLFTGYFIGLTVMIAQRRVSGSLIRFRN